MDLSKLPKLSKSASQPPAQSIPQADPSAETDANEVQPAPPPPIAARAGQPPVPLIYQPTVGKGIGGDVWFNSIIGLLLLYFGRDFFLWLFDKISGKTFNTGYTWTTGPLTGQIIAFTDPFFGGQIYGDAGAFIFGLAVFFEVFVKAAFSMGKRVPIGLIRIAFIIAIGSTLLNIFAVIKVLQMGAGLNLISALAVAFGGYIVIDLAQMLRFTRTHGLMNP